MSLYINFKGSEDMRDSRINLLEIEVRKAFNEKQKAWTEFSEAREKCNNARAEMDIAWSNRCKAEKILKKEYEKIRETSENYDRIWQEFHRIKDECNQQIESLREEIAAEEASKAKCAEMIDQASNMGNNDEVEFYFQQSLEHESRIAELNSKIGQLCWKTESMKRETERKSIRTDSSRFHALKDDYERLKAIHEEKQVIFKDLREERVNLHKKFDEAKSKYDELFSELQKLKSVTTV